MTCDITISTHHREDVRANILLDVVFAINSNPNMEGKTKRKLFCML